MSEQETQKRMTFQDYLQKKKDSFGSIEEVLASERNEFLAEYPLERLKTIPLEEYCLGTDSSKESLCYKIEFGKYKHTGFGIGGGSAKKYGVYFNKTEHCYKRGNQTIDDIDKVWPEFRAQMYSFLVDSNGDSAVVLEDYPLLQGMAMVLTKFLCLYYPEKYITIGSSSVLKGLMDLFSYPYTDDMRCHQLNFAFHKRIREDYPEFENLDGLTIGALAWDYMREAHPKKPKKTKESGLGDDDVEETHYWIYSPGQDASKWGEYSEKGLMGIGWGEMGDLTAYESRKEMQEKMRELYGPDKTYKMDSLATWQFANEVKPGDIVYAKKGLYKLVGRGVVTSEYYYDDEIEDTYNNLRQIEWKDIGEWDHPGQAVMKTLTDITSYTEYIEKLEKLFVNEEDEDQEEVKIWPEYDKEKFLEEVYMDESSYDTLVGLLQNKKNVILQGAPGVGKTYAANRLAYSIIGEKNKDRVMMVQFHQSYSYEDFIEGFRPATDSNTFEIKKGSFYNFCKKAADDMENDYFFIIDEINRGNLSKIFGELFMLIEKDKRGNALQLLYSDEKFFVPRNVYLIGMMNTADRSLAMLDYALRRRFAFYELKPAFDQERFVEYRIGLDNAKFNSLIECVKRLNETIRADDSLGEGFCVGHSYFCELDDIDDGLLKSIVEYELIPLLKEYWFDEPDKVRDWSEKLRSAIK